jgi:hypothetical protein
MYHLELRQFPHNFNHFNLGEREMRAVVDPWVRNEPIELGERKWSSHQAKLKILEGPRLPLEELSLGRGWRTAERQSQDVTERIFAEARQAIAAPSSAPAAAPSPSATPPAPSPTSAPSATPVPASPAPTSAVQPSGQSSPLSDPLALGVQLASLLGQDPAGLLSAWRQVAARSTGLSPSESLALAEREIRVAGEDPGR